MALVQAVTGALTSVTAHLGDMQGRRDSLLPTEPPNVTFNMTPLLNQPPSPHALAPPASLPAPPASLPAPPASLPPLTWTGLGMPNLKQIIKIAKKMNYTINCNNPIDIINSILNTIDYSLSSFNKDGKIIYRIKHIITMN